MGSNSAVLLVVSNIKQLAKSLKAIEKHVHSFLYIHLNIPAAICSPAPQWGRLISQMYVDGSSVCAPQTDLRILIEPIKQANATASGPSIQLQHDVDTIYGDNTTSELCESLRRSLNVAKEPVYLNCGPSDVRDYCSAEPTLHKIYNTVVLGGTFDRIHMGHKIFLSQAVLRASKRLVVGVTTDKMTASKTLPELILPVGERIRQVLDFLTDIDNSLTYEVVPIDDPFGPTQSDPDMDLIVVSAETLRGGHKVNELRVRNQLKPLEIFSIDVVESSVTDGPKEAKVSSSNTRIDLLGTRLRQPEPRPHLPKQPYIIGLTGGIATGKSKLAQRFKEMGAVIMDCDKIAHDIYEPGQRCYHLIVDHFGGDIVNAADGRIDRAKLGAIVFGDAGQLETLNGIVWPELMDEVKRRIRSHMDGAPQTRVIVLEAAVLLKAGWQRECHEVWSTIVPPELAVQRVQERNGLSAEEARKRLASQMSNREIVANSNVVFSSQWSEQFTQQQAERAWRLLMQELDNRATVSPAPAPTPSTSTFTSTATETTPTKQPNSML